MASLPHHRISAIRYARHERVAAENFLGGTDHRTPMPLDYFVWLIERDGLPPVLVDTGFGEDSAMRRGRSLLRPVEAGLRALGVDPVDVQDVILTHLHYDHAGNLDLFSGARFHVQNAEMAFATGPGMAHLAIRAPFDAAPIRDLIPLIFADRVIFHAGDQPLAPGITLRLLPGHTAGLQAVEVSTQRGPVLLASDAAHLFANLVRAVPFPILIDVPAYLEGQRRLLQLAGGLDHVIPGHDPLVLSAYPAGAAPDVARVDLPPVRPIGALL